MRKRFRTAIALALIAAALLLGGKALIDTGWGAALRSAADRLPPNPKATMWAKSPTPDSHVSSYADATGAEDNYVYLVEASDANGVTRELQLIFFGRQSDGAGWLKIEARGSSGVRYRPCDVDSVPQRARDALTPPDSSA